MNTSHPLARPVPTRRIWVNPLPLQLVPTADSMSFVRHAAGVTGLPLAPHPGAFGVRRRNHTHEGVDLYAPEGSPVFSVEDGEVVAVKPFTGPKAGLGWWLDTSAVFVEGASGVVVYGEINPSVNVGQHLCAGEQLGQVVRVLRNDKGRPTSMLHLELHELGSRSAPEWLFHEQRPGILLDPTPYLLESLEG